MRIRMKFPYVLAALLLLTSCELIGPQIHSKLPLPPVKPAIEDTTTPLVSQTDDVDKKTTQVEIINDDFTESLPKTYVKNGKNITTDSKGEYSLNFDDADLGEVAKVILSDILGRNYTISPEVTGKVTLQTSKPLSKEELLPTLDMLLSINNASLVTQNGMFLIKPSTDALFSSNVGATNMPSGYQLRIIPVRNVSATEISDILKPLLPEKAFLQVDVKRNLLLLAGTGVDLSRAMDIINMFDVDALKGLSFALYTPAHTDAGTIIGELEQIFNNKAPAASAGANGAGASATPPAGNAGGGGGNTGGASGSSKSTTAVSSSPDSFYRFIEIDRLNAILAITRKPQFLKDVENWVIRLDRTNNEGKGGINVYKVEHADATHLAATLRSIFLNAPQPSSTSVASGLGATSASNGSSFGSSLGGSGNSSFGGSNSGSGSSFGGNTNSSGQSGGGSLNSFGVNAGTGSTGASGGASGQPLLPNVKIISDDTNNSLIVVANAQEYASVHKVIKQLDILPLQVMIDATIVEVTLNDDLKYGIEWYLNKGSSSLTGGAAAPGGSGIGTLASNAFNGIGTGGFSYLLQTSNNSQAVSAVINAAATKNNINVISSPSLMVVNNMQAQILVGDQIPTQTGSLSSTATGNGAVATSITQTQTGVTLKIKPRVNSNGLVAMDIIQTVSEPQTTTSSTLDSPTIHNRSIQTTVAVQSGETIVLGGLITETNTFDTFGVPWLHEIPGIGSLFGSTTRNKDKTELVVLLTPRVMKSRQDALNVTDEFKRKLTGIYDTSTPLVTETNSVETEPYSQP